VVVLGAGIAGVSAVEAIRKASPQTRITLVSRENDLPYYRLNLTRYLAGEVDEAALPIHPAAWYNDNGVELLCGAEAGELRLDERAVVLGNGKSLTYDKLILTAGAHPFVPPIPGGQREGVRTVRSWQDARWILEYLRAGMKCVCIGGGVLGVETAGALAKRGADVTLLEGFGWLMPRQLNQAAGRRLAVHLEQIGVRLRAQAKVKEIVGDERVAGVLLEADEQLPRPPGGAARGRRGGRGRSSRFIAPGRVGRRRRGGASRRCLRPVEPGPVHGQHRRDECGGRSDGVRRHPAVEHPEGTGRGPAEHRPI
jgi:nitrite reductase (NADH) large subunit